MGYRHYFYKIEKEKSNKLRNISKEKLAKGMEYEDCEEYWDKYMTCVYEFGKLHWDNTAEKIYATGEPYFLNKEYQELANEFYKPYLMNKKSIKVAIDIYLKNIINGYDELFKSGDKDFQYYYFLKNRSVIPDEIKYKSVERCMNSYWYWKHNHIMEWLDDDTKLLANHPFYEMQIFNLIYLYKTFDFDKYDLVFFGY